MVNGRMPLFLTLLAGAVCVATLWLLQPYSVTSPWDVYTRPAQRFLAAALKRDSAALSRQSGSIAPVVWALQAARIRPESLKAVARDAEAWTGQRRGDTADVLLSAEVCSRHPVWLRFVGSGAGMKVLRASSACFESR
ncbi:MAG: hypothetical protein ACJ8DC_16860 [Gemmatimonadales bacterium]